MIREHGVTAALVLVAAGLAVALVVDRGRPTDTERQLRGARLIEAWRREEISALEIEVAGRAMRVERTRDPSAGRAWRMTAPVEGGCDASVVDRTLAALENARKLRDVTPGSPTGLEGPRARGTLTMGGSRVRFLVGGPAPTPEGSAYFQIEGGPAVVVSRDLATEVTKDPDAYREHELATLLPKDVARVTVTGALGELTLARRGAGWVSGPDRIRVARRAADRVWHGYADLRVESFLPSPPATETSRIEIAPERGDPVRIRVGSECTDTTQVAVERQLGGRGLAACVPRGAISAFTVPEAERIDRRLFHARPDELIEITLVSGAERLELARKEVGFRMRAPTARDLDAREVDLVTLELAGLFSAEARATSAKGRTSPEVGRIVVHAEASDETVVIHADGWVRREDDGAWLDLPLDRAATEKAGLLPWSPRGGGDGGAAR